MKSIDKVSIIILVSIVLSVGLSALEPRLGVALFHAYLLSFSQIACSFGLLYLHYQFPLVHLLKSLHNSLSFDHLLVWIVMSIFIGIVMTDIQSCHHVLSSDMTDDHIERNALGIWMVMENVRKPCFFATEMSLTPFFMFISCCFRLQVTSDNSFKKLNYFLILSLIVQDHRQKLPKLYLSTSIFINRVNQSFNFFPGFSQTNRQQQLF